MIASQITDEERGRIAAAVKAAEQSTSGEIYVVIDREQHGHPMIPVLWGAVLALLLPWPLYYLSYLQPVTIFLLQPVVFVLVAVAATLAPLHRLLVPDSLAAGRARETAEDLFLAHGVHLTRERTGVLFYVAIADRRVEIVADENIDSKVQQSTWDGLAQEVVREAKTGRLADGLIAAVGHAGEILARHFPAGAANPNELSDRVVEI